MKKFIYITAAALLALCSCRQDEVATFDPDHSLVCFASKITNLSLIGVTEAEPVFDIAVTLVGPARDYDRKVTVEVVDTSFNTAVLNQDFWIEDAVVPAGSLSGTIRLKVKSFGEASMQRTTTLKLIVNDDFKYIYNGLDITYVTWSNQYVRPSSYVYWSWWYFFCRGYSQNLHKLMVEVLGEEVQYSSHSASARNDPAMNYHAPSWWYNANRTLHDAVKEHDKAHPEAPYMHSDDYEVYTSYEQTVGSGTKPETPPTILSTLLIL